MEKERCQWAQNTFEEYIKYHDKEWGVPVHDDQVHLEIVDEATGKHCDSGEIGMLYATPYLRKVTPIIRYRVGDRARWIESACPCGRTTPTFKLLGRGDDVLRIGYDSVDYGAVQSVVTEVKGLSGSIQMEKIRDEGRDLLVVRVESDLTGEASKVASEELARLILDNRPSLREFIEKGTVWPLKVEVVAPGSLPRNSRTGKLRRVIDAIKDDA